MATPVNTSMHHPYSGCRDQWAIVTRRYSNDHRQRSTRRRNFGNSTAARCFFFGQLFALGLAPKVNADNDR